MLPERQSVQDVNDEENVPAGQDWHSFADEAPEILEILPSEQSVQFDSLSEAITILYLPGIQSIQVAKDDAPSTTLYLPLGHGMQVVLKWAPIVDE